MQLQNVVFEWRRLRWRKIPETLDFKKNKATDANCSIWHGQLLYGNLFFIAATMISEVLIFVRQ